MTCPQELAKADSFGSFDPKLLHGSSLSSQAYNLSPARLDVVANARNPHRSRLGNRLDPDRLCVARFANRE